MMQTWNRWLWVTNSNFALFFMLLVLSHLIYLVFFRGYKAKFSSGFIPMSAALVALTCLPSFETPNILLKLASMEIIIIWLYLMSNIIERYLSQEIMLVGWKEKLNFGALVSATTLSLLLFIEIEPTLYGFIILQALIAIILMFIYLFITLQWLYVFFKKAGKVPNNGKVILLAISPLIFTILINEIFLQEVSAIIYQIIIIFGVIFYILGFYTVIRYCFLSKAKYFCACWPSANVLLYGGSATIGIALLNTRNFSEAVVVFCWYWTLLVFIGVSLLEVIRLLIRIHKKGFIEAVFTYRTYQWARVFSLAMLYAFQSAYHLPYPISLYSYYLNSIGFYVVIFFFTLEVILLFSHIINQRFHKHTKVLS